MEKNIIIALCSNGRELQSNVDERFGGAGALVYEFDAITFGHRDIGNVFNGYNRKIFRESLYCY